MNYYDARQRQHDGRWDFTWTNDGRVSPIGFCQGWREYTPDDIQKMNVRYGERLAQEMFAGHEAERPFKDSFHVGGHDTPESARECYKQYLLALELKLEGVNTSPKPPCQVCKATGRLVRVGQYHQFFLCDEHRTRDVVAEHLHVHSFCGSY